MQVQDGEEGLFRGGNGDLHLFVFKVGALGLASDLVLVEAA